MMGTEGTQYLLSLTLRRIAYIPKRTAVMLNAGRQKMRTTTLLMGLALPLLLLTPVAADDKSGVDEDGFLQRWLVLAPIPFAVNETGTDALDKEQLKNEAKLKAKVGDKVKVSDKELVGKE